ncbi:helix-hairpin-helix domain-containing protein [Billgrantia endophytica]|uniref:Helix-hairpin-helix DNA-binding motif class 1 domain-containing protein n=1 Tax=Billgrantia endophytica TaxID=2033802 RepID=A0A2N7U3A4_9GAMM|nr:helix-hairpin-helix domain-containing protein [Halomonas endophytica]PMR74909.1 hypothetical protein C1H69_11870 [Halomonas endophytica]
MTHETLDPALSHEAALALKAQIRRLEEHLLEAMAAKPADAVAPLKAADEALEELRQQLQACPDVQLPTLDGIAQGMARLACDLCRQGACDDLSDESRQAFIDHYAAELTTVDGIGPVSARALFAHGFSDSARLRQADPEELDHVSGLGAATLARIKQNLFEKNPLEKNNP